MPIAAKGRNGPRFIKVDSPKAKPEPPPWEDASETAEEIPTDAAEPEPPGDPPPEEASEPEPRSRSSGNGHDRENQYPHGEQARGHKVDEFIYHDQYGKPYLIVAKYVDADGKKGYPQFHIENGKRMKGPPPGPRIPYNLPALLKAGPEVLIGIAEGEQCANTLIKLGIVATTNPEGAGKFGTDLVPYFVGRETVYLFEDNDRAGRDHVADVAARLDGVVKNIFVVTFRDLEEKEDVTNYVDDYGHTRADVLERMKAAPLAEPKPAKRYTLVCAADVIARSIDWLWQDHLARGSLEMTTGLPGEGKSQVQCQYVACVTTGRAWPNSVAGVPPGRAIMMTAEDNLAQIVKPRLMAAGADCTRVHFLPLIRKDKKERMFLLSEDLEVLEEAIAELGDVLLVTVDPITAFMGGGKNFDSHRATDVRSQLGPLAALAERTNIAFSAVTHPPKSAGLRALDHFLGSQAFIAAARLGHVCVAEFEDDGNGQRRPTGRTLFASAKYNVISRDTPAIAYKIERVWVTPEIETTHVVWDGVVEVSADEAIAAAAPAKDRQNSAVTFLLDVLANGPVPVKTIEERAAVRGFSKDQLDRAKKKMGVVSFKEKVLQGRSFWALPQHASLQGE
jgi:hypothetical protein